MILTPSLATLSLGVNVHGTLGLPLKAYSHCMGPDWDKHKGD